MKNDKNTTTDANTKTPTTIELIIQLIDILSIEEQIHIHDHIENNTTKVQKHKVKECEIEKILENILDSKGVGLVVRDTVTILNDCKIEGDV